jgi:hypothetical protein
MSQQERIGDADQNGRLDEDEDEAKNEPVMVLPPNYDDASKPIPPYQDVIVA